MQDTAPDTISFGVTVQIHTSGKTGNKDQTILVTHVAAQDLSVDQEAVFTQSPGVLILLPVAPSCKIDTDSGTTTATPGLVHLFDGAASSPVKVTRTHTKEPHDGVWMHVLELNALINGSTTLTEYVAPPRTLEFEASASIRHLYKDIARYETGLQLEAGSPNIIRHTLATQIVLQLLLGAAKAPRDTAPSSPGNYLERLKQYLNANLSKRITTTDMANHLSLSRASFNRILTPLLGTPPADYLRQLRLTQSLELLANTDLTIDTIAEKTGFSCRYSFAAAFKRLYHTTPARYRGTRAVVATDDRLAQADNLLQELRYGEALVEYDKVLERPAPDMVIDKVRYQKALCLYSLGEAQEACRLWESMLGGSYAFKAGKQLCKHYFSNAEYTKSLDALRRLYTQADGLQQEELVLIWTSQVTHLTELRLARPLNRYLAMRRELFVTDMVSMRATLYALMQTAQYDRVQAECASLAFELFTISRHTGRYDESPQRYGDRVPTAQVARTLIYAGRYDEALAIPGIDPASQAWALTLLGRAEEAIERFPDHCPDAYVVTRQYERLLEVSNDVAYRSCALYALGLHDKLKSEYQPGGWEWCVAQCYVDPAALLSPLASHATSFVTSARLLLAFSALGNNDEDLAREHLAQLKRVSDPDIWLSDHDPITLLLCPLTHGLLGDTRRMREDYDTVLKKHKYIDAQCLWHDVALLTGRIDLAAYRRQPTKLGLEDRLSFVQAARNDLKGKRANARDDYQSYLDSTQPLLHEHLLRHRFAEWRLTALQT